MNATMLSHISLGVSDLKRSIVFYDAILAPLGFVRLWTDVDAAGYGYRGGDDEFALNSTRASFSLRVSAATSPLTRRTATPCEHFTRSLFLTAR